MPPPPPTAPSAPAPPPPPAPPPHSTLAHSVVAIVFFAVLATIGWLDRREPPTHDTAPDGGHGFRMKEVSAEIGIRFTHRPPDVDPKLENIRTHVSGMGAAVSVVDANGDGILDLYATSSAFKTDNALFVGKKDGTFADRAAEAGLAALNQDGMGSSMGSIWADVDNDGDADAFVYKWGKPQLFANESGADRLRFADVTERAGVGRRMNSNAAVFLDADADGFVDLYVTGYFREDIDLAHLATTKIMQSSFEYATNGGHNYLYKNRGDGTFEDVTAAAGCDSTRWTLGAASADFDLNGRADIYLANDYGVEELFLNQDGKKFELAKGIGLDDDSKSGMCVAVGDVRGDGRLGVYVTNISRAGYLFQGNNLRVNGLKDGSGFENIAEGKVADCGWAWGAQFADFDDDGFSDLFVANGFISADKDREYWYGMSKVASGVGNIFEDAANWPPIEGRSLSGYEPSRVLKSQGGRRFVDVAAQVGVDDLFDGRGVAVADLGDDGAMDVIVANQCGPLLVYKNTVARDRHWVEFALKATRSNRSAIGASVTIECGGRPQTRVVGAGAGVSAPNAPRRPVGLGAATEGERGRV